MLKTSYYSDIIGNSVKTLVIEKSDYSQQQESKTLTHSDSLGLKPMMNYIYRNLFTTNGVKNKLSQLKEDENLYQDLDSKMSNSQMESNSRINKGDRTTDIMDQALSIISRSQSQSSTTQINNRPVGSIYKYIQVLKLGIFIVFLVNLITCVTLYVVVDQEAITNIEGANVLKSFIKMRSLLIEFSIHAKEMYLIDSGVITYIERETTTSKLVEYLDEAQSIIKDIGNNKLKSEIQEMIYSTQNTWWYYDTNTFYPTHIQLIDNLYHIINLLLELMNAEKVSVNDSSFLEVIRNCPAETRVKCLDTVDKAFDMQTEAIDDFESNIKVIMMIILLFTLGLQIIILSVIYYNFNKLRHGVWSKIFEITQNNLFYTATCIKERLCYFNRDESEFNIQPTKIIPEHKYVQHKFQKLAYVLSSMFVLVTIGTLLFIYYFSLPIIVSRLHDDLAYVKTSTNERNRMIYIYYLLREAYSANNLLYDNSYNHDFTTLIYESNDILLTMHQDTFEMVGYLSPDIEELYLNTPLGIFGKGLHSAVLEYSMMIKESVQTLKISGPENEFILVTLDDVTDLIMGAMDDLGVLIQNRSEDLINEGIWYALLYCISTNVSLFIFMILVLFPSVIKIKETIQKEIKIWNYLSLYDK